MNNDTRFANQYNIQWFPGHMTKTLRMMETEIQHVDASLVLLDARIPLSSLNPEIERITARKPKLYALNKADLADPAVTEEWIKYFRAADAGCVAISAKQKGGANAVKVAIEKELSGLLERRQNRGMGGAKTQVMLCGIPNVGKSTLMGMFARNTKADINVIALIGERGREVREFIERDLGEEGMRRSVVVVATSDRPALERNKAAKTATAIAEYFRDQGKDVLLMMDSLTRFSMAQREIGLASGEPPVTRGYPPSVYSEMPKLLERAGRAAVGSITGLYTVLVDGDDFNEPITDTARSILDGHIMLDRKLGHKNHYPAIDILQSISRCMSQIATREHKQAANKLKNVLATYNEAEDLINIGAYKKGSNPNIDYAISRIDAVNGFLCQGTDEKFTFEETVQMLEELFADQG